MSSPATVCEGAMIEIVGALIVAAGLGLYLLYTLIRPEYF